MLGEIKAQLRFESEPQPYGHVVKWWCWHTLEFMLGDAVAKSLRTMYDAPYNYTWRSRLMLSFYFNFTKEKNYIANVKAEVEISIES